MIGVGFLFSGLTMTGLGVEVRVCDKEMTNMAILIVSAISGSGGMSVLTVKDGDIDK